MGSQRRKVLTKELKKIGRNWGGPAKDQKKMGKMKRIDDLDKPTPYRSKKKKKKKKEHISIFNSCPFCKAKLNENNVWWRINFDERVTECPECGAIKVKECPACKRNTWLNKEGIYKHQWLGCGFEGKKKC